MNDKPAPRSIDQYLAELRTALAGEDPALVHVSQYRHRIAVLAQPQQVLRRAPVAGPTAQHD